LFSPYQRLAFYEVVWNFFFIALLYTYDQTLGLLGWVMFFLEMQRTTPHQQTKY
jgi:hypothetical protein